MNTEVKKGKWTNYCGLKNLTNKLANFGDGIATVIFTPSRPWLVWG